MIGESEFNKLTGEEKELLCIKEGQCINVIYLDGEQLMLFAVNRLFVEIIYSIEQNQITDIRLLKPERLQLYTNNINISDALG